MNKFKIRKTNEMSTAKSLYFPPNTVFEKRYLVRKSETPTTSD